MHGNAERDDRQGFSHLMWEVAARTSALAEAALADLPLTPAGTGLLDAIEQAPGTTIAELARTSPTSAQAISQVITRLERLGFVKRELTGRGRAIGLYVTAEGSRARREAGARKAAFDDEIRDALGADRHAQLCALLREARPIVTGLDEERRRAGGAAGTGAC